MSYSHNRLYVIIPAAGSGSRMHSDKNKLFMEVDGISVIDRTMAAFRRFADEYGVDIEAIPHGKNTSRASPITEWSRPSPREAPRGPNRSATESAR